MKKNGFTLIEMIIVMAILITIISATTSVLISSSKTFSKGSSFTNMQNQSLVLSKMITNQLRNSTSFKLYNTVPSSFDTTKNYIYINETDNKIYLKKIGTSQKALLNTPNIKQNLEFSYINDSNINAEIILSDVEDTYENLFSIGFINIIDDTSFVPDTSLKYKCIEYVES